MPHSSLVPDNFNLSDNIIESFEEYAEDVRKHEAYELIGTLSDLSEQYVSVTSGTLLREYSGANFSGSTIVGTVGVEASQSGGNVALEPIFMGCDFTGADLSALDFDGRVHFVGCKMGQVKLPLVEGIGVGSLGGIPVISIESPSAINAALAQLFNF